MQGTSTITEMGRLNREDASLLSPVLPTCIRTTSQKRAPPSVCLIHLTQLRSFWVKCYTRELGGGVGVPGYLVSETCNLNLSHPSQVHLQAAAAASLSDCNTLRPSFQMANMSSFNDLISVQMNREDGESATQNLVAPMIRPKPATWVFSSCDFPPLLFASWVFRPEPR